MNVKCMNFILKSYKLKIDEQLLDTLLDLSEVNNFKEMMMNFKWEKEKVKDNKIQFGIQIQYKKFQKIKKEKIQIIF